MTNPETDIIAQIDALAGPDPEADARAEAETVALAARAAQFVSNRARRWRKCPKRACRRARACTGEGPPAALPPCGAEGDWRAINGLALFAVLERLHAIGRDLRAQAIEGPELADRELHEEMAGAAPFSQRSGDGD